MDFLVQKQWHVTGIDLTLSSTMFEYFLSAFLRGLYIIWTRGQVLDYVQFSFQMKLFLFS